MVKLFSFQATEEENDDAREAFKSVNVVKAGRSNFLNNDLAISKRIKQIAMKEFNYTITGEISVNVAKFYDAALLYCQALFKVLNEETNSEDNIDNYSEGERISFLTRNTTVQGSTGDVVINANGDILEEYFIISMDPVTRQYQPVIQYSAKTGNFTKIGQGIRYPGSCDSFLYRQMLEKLGSKWKK